MMNKYDSHDLKKVIDVIRTNFPSTLNKIFLFNDVPLSDWVTSLTLGDYIKEKLVEIKEDSLDVLHEYISEDQLEQKFEGNLKN